MSALTDDPSWGSLLQPAVTEAATRISDMAASLAAPTSAEAARDGQRVTLATQMVGAARELEELAVAEAQAYGASWDTIGECLDDVTRQAAQSRLGKAVKRHWEAMITTWLLDATSATPARVRGRKATRGLEPMTIVEHNKRIAAAAKLLGAGTLGEPGQQKALAIGLARRTVRLYERMRAEGPGPTRVRPDQIEDLLAGARARLAGLEAERQDQTAGS